MAIDWEAWKWLLGAWEGEHASLPGDGTGGFSFSFDLDNNILVRKSRTTFPATPERPGFTHDDLMIIYTDIDGVKRAIYFDNEEHTIHYEVKVSADQKQITLESNPVPEMPQFRFTYTNQGEDRLHGRFEMTPPGKPGAFFTYIEGGSRRTGKK